MKTEKIRILQSMDSIGVGGTEVFVMNLYRSIDRSRFDIDFVVYDANKTDYLEEVLDKGDKVFRFHQRYKNRFLNYLDQKRFVTQVLDKYKYDLIHCNGNSFLGILRAAIPAKQKGIHIITHSHNTGEKHDGVLNKIALEYLRRRISSLCELGYSCSVPAGKHIYTDCFIQSSQYKIIDNGINPDQYRYNDEFRNKTRAEFKVSDDCFLIGHVGRFEYPKNQMYLFDVFNETLQLMPEARLMLVGDGIQRKEFEEKVHKLGIEDRVYMPGLRRDVNELYSGFDLFVLPSIHEGFPFVLVEAQMNGLKCIVTDNIDKGVDISGGVKFLSVGANPAYWSEEIVNTKGRLFDEQIQKVVSRYDIKRIVGEITKDYLLLVRQEEVNA